MKTRSKLIAAGTAFTVSALLVVSQQAFTPSDPLLGTVPNPNEEAFPPLTEAFPPLVLDRETWDVVDPYNRGLDLSESNTPELRWERYKAVLGLENPEDYQKQFPPAPEEIEASNAAALAILQPKSLEEFLAEPRTEEEQERLLNSLEINGNP